MEEEGWFRGWKSVNNSKHATTKSASNNISHSKSRKSIFFKILIMRFCPSWHGEVAPPTHTCPLFLVLLTLLNIFAWFCSFSLFVCCCLNSWRASMVALNRKKIRRRKCVRDIYDMTLYIHTQLIQL